MNPCICHLLMGEDNTAKKTLHGADAGDTKTVNWSFCFSRNSHCQVRPLILTAAKTALVLVRV